jgi:hypothetical protein
MSRLLKDTAHFLARRLDTWGRKNQADRLIRAEGPFEELSPYNGRCERCARKGRRRLEWVRGRLHRRRRSSAEIIAEQVLSRRRGRSQLRTWLPF